MRKIGEVFTQISAEPLKPSRFVGLNAEGQVVAPKNAKAIVGITERYIPDTAGAPVPVVQALHAYVRTGEAIEAGDYIKADDEGLAVKAGAGEAAYAIACESVIKDQLVNVFLQRCTAPEAINTGDN